MPIDKDLQKDVLKEAVSEWMDERFAMFGRWSFHSLLVLAFAGAVYLAMRGQGWSKA